MNCLASALSWPFSKQAENKPVLKGGPWKLQWDPVRKFFVSLSSLPQTVISSSSATLFTWIQLHQDFLSLGGWWTQGVCLMCYMFKRTGWLVAKQSLEHEVLVYLHKSTEQPLIFKQKNSFLCGKLPVLLRVVPQRGKKTTLRWEDNSLVKTSLIKAIREFQWKGNIKTLNIYNGNQNLFLLSLRTVLKMHN